MDAAAFRFRRADFGPLPVRLNHMDIYLSFVAERVHGTNTLDITALQPMESVTLDARDIDVFRAEWIGDGAPLTHEPLPPRAPAGDAAPASPGAALLAFEFRREEGRLVVRLPRPVEAGARFTIRLECACTPTDNILEGIYKDTTPAGAPQQYMSQCQQWGFQRILPVIDDCTAKCTMVTTVEADARYTHLISNGNARRASNPDGRPVPKPGDPSRQLITYENPVRMAPYLFLVAAGTWDVLADEAVYPSGRRVRLEYLVPPGRAKGAEVPMRILKESVLWQGLDQRYEYKLDVYRTICMEKSNFGGMENLGNTTILTSAALVDEFTDDRRLEYAHAVIVHEFEHNHCGSDVTMESPFDMWLNEAFTVDVERRFMRSQLDPDVMRLDQVDAMRAPIGGPLAVEDGGHLGNIVREGFNSPDELVDGLTYVKAAEVIRMLRLVLGEETFREGKDLYFRRHAGGNANSDQFFRCFEEVSGRRLADFKREWLHTIGYPQVRVASDYDVRRRQLRLVFEQRRTGQGGVFTVPIDMAAVDAEGRDIPETVRTVELSTPRHEVLIHNVRRPAFLSLNRDCSFYGTLADTATSPRQLALQIRLDPNRFNRVEAMRRLTDLERLRLIHEPAAAVSAAWLDAYGAVLRDDTLPPGLRSFLLRIDEQSLDRDFVPFCRERYAARQRLLRAAAERWMDELRRVFAATDTYAPAREPRDGIDERRLKGVLLRTLIAADTGDVQRLAEEHFRRAWNITDRAAALLCVNLGGHPGRGALMEEGYQLWKDHVGAYSTYLQIVGAAAHPDTFERMAAEERRATFHIEHPGHCRALYLPMAGNNALLWTDEGLAWMGRTAIRLAPVNEFTTNRLIAALQHVHKLADDLKPKVLATLRAIRESVDPARTPSVAGRLDAYLTPPQGA